MTLTQADTGLSMLILLILLAQPATPSVTGPCPGVDSAFFESIDKLPAKAAEARLLEAKAKVAKTPTDLQAVVEASSIAMRLYARTSKQAVIAAHQCGTHMLLGVPDTTAEAYRWLLMSDQLFFDYVKANQGKVEERLIRCAAITPFKNAFELRDIRSLPRRLKTALEILPNDLATTLAVQVLGDTVDTGAAYDVLETLAIMARDAKIVHHKVSWYLSVAYTCLREPRKALPLLLEVQKVQPDDKMLLENLAQVREQIKEVEAAEKARAAKFGR